MGHRRRARELALQLLFEVELTRDAPGEVVTRFWAARSVPRDVRAFADILTEGALEHLADIDTVLAGTADQWRLDRMAAVDRNVLRIAIYELCHRADIPPAVVIDEAIEVARKYGSEDSAPFVNGILDAVRRRVATPAEET